MTNKNLKKRILDISYKHKLSHIGSCITAVDIIDEIFQQKKPDEKFVLSSGHAGLALYVVIEKYNNRFEVNSTSHNHNAEDIFNHHGVHPDRCEECHIDCSAGSLGQGLPIAVGMALADRTKNVYCLISDGECSEGSIWEALRIANEQKLKNLHIYINANGWGAYKKITQWDLKNMFFVDADYCNDEYSRYPDTNIIYKQTSMRGWPSWLQGQDAHYVVMDKKKYEEALG